MQKPQQKKELKIVKAGGTVALPRTTGLVDIDHKDAGVASDKEEEYVDLKPTAGTVMLTGRRKVGKATGGVPKPLDVVTTVRRHRALFTNAASGTTTAVTVTANNLAGALGAVCTVANSVVTCFASSIRIHYIRLYPVNTASSETFADWAWSHSSGNEFVKDQLMQQPLSGSTVGGFITVRPPKKSLFSDWFTLTQSLNVGSVRGSQGTIVELCCDFTMATTFSPVTRSVTTASLGAFYWLALDGVSSNAFRPIDLTTTT